MPAIRRKLTKDEIIELEALSAVLNQEQIADYFNFSHDTLNRIMKADDNVLRAYKRGKAKAIVRVGKSLLSQCDDGSVPAQTFYLKTQAGWSETKQDDGDSEELQPMNITFEVKDAVSDIKITRGS